MTKPVLLWLRQDLRLHDQPALTAACGEGPVIPVYVLDDETPGRWRIGAAQRWWLHHSLAALADALKDKGARLILRRGRAAEVLGALAGETGAERIHAIRHAEPWWRAAEDALGERLSLHDGNHLAPLGAVTTGSGGQYKVYSAFWRALGERMPPGDALPSPHRIPAPERWPESEALADWKLLPEKPDWAAAFGAGWTPGEAEAHQKAKRFAAQVGAYSAQRDLPSADATARLSPHLHFGEISPRILWNAVAAADAGMKFRKELAWRDFASNLVLDMPDYGARNGRARYDALRWRSGAAAEADLRAWQRGRTGYPIVDAGMRQLWATGWMHNRVRMIAASFLVKHLLIDWREGERWFWDTLVDADYANNAVNWQWVSGTGIDSNMWGRIMAPLVQSERFDAGAYIREWVPELAAVSAAAIHDPEAEGCRPAAYPAKIVAHREGRQRALEAAARLG